MENCSSKNVIQKSWSAKFFPSPKLGARSPPMCRPKLYCIQRHV